MRLTEKEVKEKASRIRHGCTIINIAEMTDLLDTIEAWQQEILEYKFILKQSDECQKNNTQQIQQLQAENAIKKAGGEKNKYPFKECNSCNFKAMGACAVSGDLESCSNPEVNKTVILSIDFHNPADVEALELAKEALENIGMFNVDDPLKSDRLCREALKAIKAVGK